MEQTLLSMVCKAFHAAMVSRDAGAPGGALPSLEDAEERERLTRALANERLQAYGVGYDVSSGDRLEDRATLVKAADMLTVIGNDQEAMMASAQVRARAAALARSRPVVGGPRVR